MFPHFQQLDSMDCSSTCLRMIAKHYGCAYSIQNLREKAFITGEGVSMLGISEAAETIGFRTSGREDHHRRAREGMSPTLHTTLEPMAFRGLL